MVTFADKCVNNPDRLPDICPYHPCPLEGEEVYTVREEHYPRHGFNSEPG